MRRKFQPESAPDRPSKSQLKREALDLQKMGVALLDMPADLFAAIDMPDNLREALHELRRITSHGAKLRQTQYVGKLLRAIDAEPLQRALDAWRHSRALDAALLRRSEAWLVRLLDEDGAVTAWIAGHPQAATQEFRALVRSAQREAEAALKRNPEHPLRRTRGKACRKLFDQVRTSLAADAEAAAEAAAADQPADDDLE